MLLSIILLTLAGRAILVCAALLRVCGAALLGGAVAGLVMAGPLDARGDTGSWGIVEVGLGTLSSESGISLDEAAGATAAFLRGAARFLAAFVGGRGGDFAARGGVLAATDPSSGETRRCSGVGWAASC